MNIQAFKSSTGYPVPRRDPLIDGIRGVAILLVVLGHAIQQHLPGFNSNIVFKAIYSFHMPLFIGLSGYLAFGRMEASFWPLIRKKAKQLVIPFLAWHGVAYFLSVWHTASYPNPVDWFYKLWLVPDLGLWFLWVLFLCFVVAGLCTYLPRRFYDAALFGSILLLYMVPYSSVGIALLRWLYPFFVAGYFCAKYQQTIRRCPLLPLAIGGLLLWIIQIPFFSRDNPMPMETLYTGWGLRGGPWAGLFFRYAVAVSGIVALSSALAVCVRWSPGAIPQGLLFIGAASMDIYVSHQFFTAQPIGFTGVHIIPVSFIFGVAGSLCLSYFVLRRIAWVRRLFLGIWK